MSKRFERFKKMVKDEFGLTIVEKENKTMKQIQTGCNQLCEYNYLNNCLLPSNAICPMTNVSYNANQLADITNTKIKEIVEGKFYEYGSFSIISNYCNGYSVIDFDNRKMLKCVDTLDEAVNVINQYEQTKNKEEADYANY